MYEPGRPLDDVDQGVLECLLRDARATFAEIGEQVGLSAPAAKRRVDRLVERGAVRGFTAVVDPAVMGWRTEAFVEIHCEGTVVPAVLGTALAAIPEVVEAFTVTGRADALLRVLARDVQHLERAIERVRSEASITGTESVIVLSRIVDRSPPPA